MAERDFRALIDAVVAGDANVVARMLDRRPELATARALAGATRQSATASFFESIAHYLYAGDTALHIAAAANRPELAKLLLARGADPRAVNRRGAQPLHYAVDGGPGGPVWGPQRQVALIRLLVAAGADPNARDKSGTAPLHRAIRNRCAAGVRELLVRGADPSLRNGSGSTPRQLAEWTTGKSGSGTRLAKEQQEEIQRVLAGV